MSKKSEVAEVLFNLPESALTTKQIRWMMSHLPDSDEMGESAVTSKEMKKVEPVKWDHSNSSFHKAFGIPDMGALEVIVDKLEDAESSLKRGNDAPIKIKKSMLIEAVRINLTETELCFLIGLGVNGIKNYMIEEMRSGVKDILDNPISTGDPKRDVSELLKSLQSQAFEQQVVGPGSLEDMLDALESGKGRGAIADENGNRIEFRNLEEFKQVLIKRLEQLRDELKRARDGK